MSFGLRGLQFKVVDSISLINFEWYSKSKVGNIGISLFWEVCEKLCSDV